MTAIRMDPEVAPHLRLAVVEADGVAVVEHDPLLWREIETVAARLCAEHAGREPALIEGLQPARELYRRTGVDPTKLRPSSEALLRRVLRGDGLPKINSLVDINNLCSLEFLLPIGLHDLDRVAGDIVLRRGASGEGYEAIGKGWYSVEGRLTAADDQGPCGSPTSDSQRTMITLATQRCLMLIYSPRRVELSALEAHAAKAADRIARYTGAVIMQTAVL